MPKLANMPRMHRIARWQELAVSVAGLVCLMIGTWFLLNTSPGPNTVWPILLVLLGPVLVFIGLIGYFTYLERIEEETYFPDPFRRTRKAERRTGDTPHWHS